MSKDLNQLICFNFYSGWREVSSIFKEVFGNEYSLQNYYILELCELDKKLKMNELTKKLGLRSSAASTLVSRMEKKDLLTRIFSTSDRRVVYVKLTKEGVKLRDKFREKAPLFENALANNASADDIKNLQKMVNNLRERNDRPSAVA